MLGIIDVVLKRGKATLSVFAMLALAGAFAYNLLPVAANPAIDVPFVRIAVTMEGASARDVERLITRPIEQELQGLEDLKELNSYSSQSRSSLFLEFELVLTSEEALERVRNAMDSVLPRLPSEADEPLLEAISVNEEPAVVVNLVSTSVPIRELYRTARDLKRELETITGVLAVEMRGERERVLEVVTSPEQLDSVKLTAGQLYQVIGNNNRLITAGRFDSGEGAFNVNVPSVLKNARDVMELPVKSHQGATLTLSDIAQVRDTYKDARNYTQVNGLPAVSLEVTRREGEFLIPLVKGVRAKVEKQRSVINPGIDIIYTQDSSPWAEGLVSELQGNILTAIMLVMTIVVAALGLRSSLLVGIAVPFSFLVSFISLYLIGYSFNFMVMFGMLLAMGMLIDGSVVVVEYADRKMAEGASPATAYRSATRRMFLPVVASILTTLAAFLPLVFWPDVSGKFMRYLPVTVFMVLTASLLYALVFLPVLGALIGRPSQGSQKSQKQLSRLEYSSPDSLTGFTGQYAKLLSVIVKRPILSLAYGVVILISIFGIYGDHSKGVKFFTDTEPQFLLTEVRARGNLSPGEVRDLMADVELRLLGIPEFQSTYLVTGARWRGSPPDTVGLIYGELRPFVERERASDEFLAEVQLLTSNMPGLIVTTREMEQGPPVGRPIQVELLSDFPQILEQTTLIVAAELESYSEIRDVETTLPLPQVDWNLQVDRARADELGVSLSEAGAMIQLITNGIRVSEYRPDGHDEEVDIRVRFAPEYRTLTAIENLMLTAASGEQVPLSSIAKLVPEQGVQTIFHVDSRGRHQVSTGVVAGVQPSSVVVKVKEWLATADLDPRVQVNLRGSDEQERDAGIFLMIAALAAIMVMMLLLVIQFNSFYQAFLILSAIVMSTAGVLIGLLISGRPFSIIMTGVGIVALAGIVVNNNIVLIDTYNHLRRQFPTIQHEELVIRTSVLRLRPVLLTTGTTILGLLPISLHLSFNFLNGSVVYGGETTAWWVQMANAIVWGLGFSTMLTLIVTPAALQVPFTLKTMMRALRIRRVKQQAVAAETGSVQS